MYRDDETIPIFLHRVGLLRANAHVLASDCNDVNFLSKVNYSVKRCSLRIKLFGLPVHHRA